MRNPYDFSQILASATAFGGSLYWSGCHTTFRHRYHLVWAPKYRYKVLIGDIRLGAREVSRKVCAELGVAIINRALSRGYFSTTSGNITDDIIMRYLDRTYPQ